MDGTSLMSYQLDVRVIIKYVKNFKWKQFFWEIAGKTRAMCQSVFVSKFINATIQKLHHNAL